MQSIPHLETVKAAMKELDGREWQAGFAFQAFGVTIGLRTNRADALEKTKIVLTPTAKMLAISEVEHLFSLWFDETGETPTLLFYNEIVISQSGQTEDWLNSLNAFIKLSVGENAPNHVFVHAGSVVWNGNSIVIPGRSRAGKTTLTAEFVKAGAIYYSDEYAIIGTDGLIYPYPKPLSIREEQAGGKQIDYSVETLGGKQGVEPLPAKIILITEFERTARWNPRLLSAGEGVLELMTNAVPAQTRPQFTLNVLSKAAANAFFLKSKRGETAEIIEAAINFLENASQRLAA